MLWHFLALLSLSLLICCTGSFIGKQLGLIDHPDGVRKLHGRATPLVGGVALTVALSPYFLGFASFDLRLQFFGALCLFALGALDDRRSISPTLRFAILFGVVLFLVRAVPEPAAISFVFASLDRTLTFSSLPWNAFALIVTFALVGFIVSVNMADGVNGLATGMLLLWAALFLVVAAPPVQLAAALLCLALLVIWLFNLSGRLFMGDSGIYSAAGLITVLIFGQAMREPASLPLDTIAAWVVVPVLDCLRLIVTRSMAGKSPLMGDRNHLHHRLLEVLPAPQACGVYLLSVGGPAALSLALPQYNLVWLALACINFILMLNATKIAAVFIQRDAVSLQQTRTR